MRNKYQLRFQVQMIVLTIGTCICRLFGRSEKDFLVPHQCYIKREDLDQDLLAS